MTIAPYDIHQLDFSCWRIEENGVRSFLVIGTQSALLIDSGFGTGNIKEAIAPLTTLPLMLVNTHTDRDHIGCNNLFAAAYMHPAEFDRYHQGGGKAHTALPLWEGQCLDLGNRALEVILIPGHTPGSIALLDKKNRILFGGDSVQAGTIYMFGPGRNLPAYLASMEKLLQRNSEFDTVYPSHGPIPVDASIIPQLIAGGTDLLNQNLAGTASTNPNIPARLYDIGAAKFLY